MSKRDEHTFQFTAERIAAAAAEEGAYHRTRLACWQDELRTATDRVQETASIKIEEQPITGGFRPVVSVDYGDPAAHARMQDAYGKVQSHREAAERFETDATVYGTQQGRVYELATDDVHYYRLGGGNRED